MVQTELQHGKIAEHVATANCPLPREDEFAILRLPRSDRGKPRGPQKPVKVSKAKPGRPPVYDGTERRIIAAALRKLGYTKGREFLRKERKLKVSMTLCRAVAEQYGITFQRGRPAA